MRGYVLGQGGLDGSGAEGKADGEQGMDHVVEAQPLRAHCPGHENAVKKAQDPADEAGGGQKKGAGQEGPPAGCEACACKSAE